MGESQTDLPNNCRGIVLIVCHLVVDLLFLVHCDFWIQNVFNRDKRAFTNPRESGEDKPCGRPVRPTRAWIDSLHASSLFLGRMTSSIM